MFSVVFRISPCIFLMVAMKTPVTKKKKVTTKTIIKLISVRVNIGFWVVNASVQKRNHIYLTEIIIQ